MTATLPLILKLQAEAANPDASVTNLLRTAKIAATKLNLADALIWIDRELNGYTDQGLRVGDLPPYRRIAGISEAFHPLYGWQPIQFRDPTAAENYSEVAVGMALGQIEKLVSGSSGSIVFPHPPALKAQLDKAMSFPTQTHVEIHKTQLWNIVDQVRNLILNWSLELEKAGVLGEDMHFSEQEKGEAKPVTQQFFIQNVGVLGNVTDQASVTHQQRARAEIELDFGQVRDFLKQARATLPQLPKEAQETARPLLETIDRELKTKKPQSSKIREALGSLRKIGEGVAGNLTAQGIIAMVRAIVGA